MARTIKFRGRRIDNGAWVYGMYFTMPGWHLLFGETRPCIEDAGIPYVVDAATIGQFTGYTDDSGSEIYEGDIMAYSYATTDPTDDPSGIGEVMWSTPWGAWLVTGRDEFLASLVGDWDVRVIGNRYETPELMRGVSANG